MTPHMSHADADPAGAGRMSFAHRAPWPGLGALFAGELFRFRFQLRPARAGWLGPGDGDAGTLARRREILGTPRGIIWTPAANATWSRVEDRLDPALVLSAQGRREPSERAREVSGHWAPDFVLLRLMGGEHRMVGGSVCFPSGWDPVEKLGGTLAMIHGPVPTLNVELGERIARFIAGLGDGDAFERDNWGVAGTGRLDLHPCDEAPRIMDGAGLEGLWFRLEEQAFMGLGDGHVLFLIHVRTWPLHEVMQATSAREAFARMVTSMPPEVARYKGLAALQARP